MPGDGKAALRHKTTGKITRHWLVDVRAILSDPATEYEPGDELAARITTGEPLNPILTPGRPTSSPMPTSAPAPLPSSDDSPPKKK